MLPWRFPDKPLTAHLPILGQLAPREWLAQMKPDGWRALVRVEPDGGVSLTSRHREPITFGPALRSALAEVLRGLPSGTLLDGEYMGRRGRQPEGLILFDWLAEGDVWLGELGAATRFAKLLGLEAACAGPVRIVPWTLTEWHELFFSSRQTAGMEGIVLKHTASRFIGSPRHCENNRQWLKVKWK